VLHQFTGGSDGGQPIAAVAFDATGNLYGTTGAGGIPRCFNNVGWGVVFKLSPSVSGARPVTGRCSRSIRRRISVLKN
jgi:hypothetical protein